MPPAPEPARGRLFRRTLLRVLLVQGIALAVLWWLQAHYGT
jgi:hypothetical protein